MYLLKEWDSVCRALEEGRQILLARKGGILDDEGRFLPSHPEFLLLPTRWHQSEQEREALKPSELARSAASQAAPDLRVRLFGRMTDSFYVLDFAKLRSLDAEHVWTSDFLEKRFAWGKERGLAVIVVRVYRLANALALPAHPALAGCKSWVEEPSIDVSRLPPMTPVLSDVDFSKKRMGIRKKLR